MFIFNSDGKRYAYLLPIFILAMISSHNVQRFKRKERDFFLRENPEKKEKYKRIEMGIAKS